jgi:type VI secretion system secreted protein VgrG
MPQDPLGSLDLFSQTNRLFRLESPLGDSLLLDRLQGTERLSTPYRFTLDLLSERADLTLKDLMAQELRIRLATEAGDRYFSGFVTRFAQTGTDGGLAFYQAVLEPWTGFLALRTNCRAFQGVTLPELLRKLFDDHPRVARYELQLTEGKYPPMAYCVQYRESDYAFMSRLLEAHGIFYFHRFDPQGATLVLADDSRAAPAMPIRDRIAYNTEPGSEGRDSIDHWASERELVATAFAIKSFDFQNPQDPLPCRQSTTHAMGDLPDLERYEHLGSFAYPDCDAGATLARLRVQEEELRSKGFLGQGTCRFLTCGHCFELLDHFDPGASVHDRLFLVTHVTHEGANNYRDQGGRAHYRNQFGCVRSAIRFRPPLATPRPVLPGFQTATVVGPKGQEIFCDDYGRVRVQFHWDREGTFNEASSCWVRVMTPWAGARFGMVAVPRVGQEVLVGFLEGNPDRPIIIGEAYNQWNMPPWELPANRTQTGILTRSTQDGSYETANALRFEDRQGAEEVWLHAEKDQRIEVEHDESHSVGQDRRKVIGRDERTEVRHDRIEQVGNDEHLSVGMNQSLQVGATQHIAVGATQNITVGTTKFERVNFASTEVVGGIRTLNVGAAYGVHVAAAKEETVGLASMETVGLDKGTTVIKAYHISAGDLLEIVVGKSRFVLDKEGKVTITGTEVEISSSGPVRINGKDVLVNNT